LAQARTDLRLGIEEVAHRLHLSQHQIQALEIDDYRGLPGATYVRGYLRSYAMLLGLDPVTVLDAHSRITTPPVSQPDFTHISPQREITSRHHQVRLVTYLVGAIVIGLAVAWWQGRDRAPELPLAVAPPGETGSIADIVGGPGGTADTPPPQAVSPAVVANVPTTTASPTKPEKPAATVSEKSTPPPVAPPAAPIATAVPATPVPTKPGAPAIRGRLSVRASQDTWLDVRDARQVKLVYETITAGRSITLEGVVPISIFVGNAAGTQIEFNGKPIDINRFKRGMVARFTVGEAESTASPVVLPAAGAQQ